MRVLISGSRDYPRKDQVRRFVALMRPLDTVIVGGARGVDTWAQEAAEERPDLGIEIHPADWEVYGRRAGAVRNAAMVDRADLVVAFWDGKSRGTKNTIDFARNMMKPYAVVFP